MTIGSSSVGNGGIQVPFLSSNQNQTRGRVLQDEGKTSKFPWRDIGCFSGNEEYRYLLEDSLVDPDTVTVIEGCHPGNRGYLKQLIVNQADVRDKVLYWRQNESGKIDVKSLKEYIEANGVKGPQGSLFIGVRLPPESLTMDILDDIARIGLDQKAKQVKLVIMTSDYLSEDFSSDKYGIDRLPVPTHDLFDAQARSYKLVKNGKTIGFSPDRLDELWQLFQGIPTNQIGKISQYLAKNKQIPNLALSLDGAYEALDQAALKLGIKIEPPEEDDHQDIWQPTLDEIVNLPDSVRDYANFISRMDKIKRHLPQPGYSRNLIMYGPPGCGKTVTAKAIAKEHDMIFFAPKTGEILSKWVAEDVSRLRKLFKEAIEQHQTEGRPTMIFLDEVDAYGNKRGSGDTAAGKHANDLVDALLQEIDGIGDENLNIFVVAATNHGVSMDPALLSRFGCQARYRELDSAGAGKILWTTLRKIKHCDITEQELSELKLPEDIFKDARNIQQLVTSAVMIAVDRHETAGGNPNEGTVTIEDVNEALARFSQARETPKPPNLSYFL